MAIGLAGLNTELTTASASDTYAALTQEQWETYVNTFVPIENQLIAYATDPNQVNLAMNAAQQNVDGSYATAAGTQQRQNAALGVTLDVDQQQAQTRARGLSQALAGVQGQNVAGDLVRQRQQSILGNPAPTTSQIAIQATGLQV